MTCPTPSSSLDTFYLGNPGAMDALPMPDAGIQPVLGRSTQLRTRSDGGVTRVSRPKVKRQWTAGFTERQLDETDVLLAYSAGVTGRGPFRLIDPNWRNALDVDTSTMSGTVSANTQWVNSSGALLPLDATVQPSETVGRRSGVLSLAALAVGDYAFPGSIVAGVPHVDTSRAVPLVEDADVTASVDVYKPIGGGAFVLRLAIAGVTPDGAWTGTYSQVNDVALVDGWQRVSTLLPAGLWFASAVPWLTLVPIIHGGPSGGSGVRIAAAMLSYSSTSDPYVIGFGCPFVHVDDMRSMGASVWEYRTVSGLLFSEA